MNFVDNLVLKENYTFVAADSEGMITGGEHGLYNRDTRMLSRYVWRWESGERPLRPLVVETPRPDTLHAHYALIRGPSQLVAVRRSVTLTAVSLVDELEVSNTSREPQVVELTLELAGDFVDLFEVRGWGKRLREAPDVRVSDSCVALRQRASDGVEQGVEVTFSGVAPRLTVGTEGRWAQGSGAPAEGTAADADAPAPSSHPAVLASYEVVLRPGESVTLRASVAIDNPLDRPPVGRMSYESWRESFDGLLASDLARGPHRGALVRAIDDLRALLLFTPEGPVPAAGIPWFVAAFGRDSLLAAHFLLPYRPDVAAGTLRYLARWQARDDDPSRDAEPGKIMHELRFGELTRTGRTPHSPYYGSVDATPLFLMLLDGHCRATGEDSLLTELRPAWEAALGWLVERADVDGDGFIEFGSAVEGLGHLDVQSWKDSGDSMSHAGGELAQGALAVSEVQGYAYAAYSAAAAWYGRLGEPDRSAQWRQRADRLKAAFDEAFWLPELGTYAMALDGEKRPLAVLSSDAGQLLWTGIVREERAAALVATLLGDRMWTGWGLRTLGADAARYNPVSYHNGSVWPHDTALFAAGLARYGFAAESSRVRAALFDLASRQPDLRLPELVAGYPRDLRPPVPYPVACRPQAWDAAALLYLASMEHG